MSRVAKQAAILTVARLANYGLMVLSPVLLVRLLDVVDFGRYREFLLYATLMVSFAGFSVGDSLLTFLPRFAEQRAQVAVQTARLTFITSLIVVFVAAALDVVLGGGLLGGFRWTLVLYVLLFTNLDFWEWYWLAQHRSTSVFIYSSTRLLARMTLVVVAAAATGSLSVIIWSLIALESARIIGSAIALRRLARVPAPPLPSTFASEQLRFCLPWGFAVMLTMVSRNLGNVAVVKLLGPAVLAQYTIGLYAEPIITALRNSLSSVVLPEMVRRNATGDALDIWRRATVVNCALLFPAAAFGATFASPVITFVFGVTYAPAAPVMQVFMLFLVRECFDMTLPFRARGQSRPFVLSGIFALAVNLVLALILVPRVGAMGAAIAMVAAAFVDLSLLIGMARSSFGRSMVDLLPWTDVAKVGFSAGIAAASAYLLSPDGASFIQLAVAFSIFAAAYVPLVLALRVPAVRDLLARFRPRRAA